MQEVTTIRGYRIASMSIGRPISVDTGQCRHRMRFDRDRLVHGLERYFRKNQLEANWDAIRQTEDERLITTLAMICPFEPSEKQALLEAKTLADRAESHDYADRNGGVVG